MVHEGIVFPSCDFVSFVVMISSVERIAILSCRANRAIATLRACATIYCFLFASAVRKARFR